MPLELKYENCLNCGAPVRGHKCCYCGTLYKITTPEYHYHGSWDTSGSSGFYYTGHHFSSSQPLLFKGKPITKDNEEEVRKYVEQVPIIY